MKHANVSFLFCFRAEAIVGTENTFSKIFGDCGWLFFVTIILPYSSFFYRLEERVKVAIQNIPKTGAGSLNWNTDKWSRSFSNGQSDQQDRSERRMKTNSLLWRSTWRNSFLHSFDKSPKLRISLSCDLKNILTLL